MQIVSDLETAKHSIFADHGNTDLEGYYCIQTQPFNCNCRQRAWTFIHYSKQIIVWPEKDDDNMLKAASEFKKLGFDPKIIEYKSMMGKAIEWDAIPIGATIG